MFYQLYTLSPKQFFFFFYHLIQRIETITKQYQTLFVFSSTFPLIFRSINMGWDLKESIFFRFPFFHFSFLYTKQMKTNLSFPFQPSTSPLYQTHFYASLLNSHKPKEYYTLNRSSRWLSIRLLHITNMCVPKSLNKILTRA